MYTLNISPIAFSIAGVNIYWYGILFAVSLLTSWCFASAVVRRTGSNFSVNDLDKFLFGGIIATILGARLGHIIFFDLRYYITYPSEIFMIRNGGLSFHGGLIGLLLFAWLYSRRRKISLKFLADVLCLAAPLGLITGRLANFFNQELVGKVWASDKAVIFPLVDGLPRYPTQLFEAMTEGLLAFLINIIILRCRGWKSVGSGVYLFSFLTVYSSSRFVIEFFKDVPQINFFDLFSLSTGQILCLLTQIIILI